MLNEGLLEKQVGLIGAMEVSIATLRGFCKAFMGVAEETLGTPGAVRGHLLALQLPSSAWTSFGKCCVCLGQVWLLSRNLGQHTGW